MIWFVTQAAIVVIHTPLWVWVLYALLLYLGFQRTRDSILPLWRMLILPVIVVALAIFSAISAGMNAVPAILLGLVIGLAAGWHLERDGATRRLPDGTVRVRGEWWSFTQIVFVLLFRYATSEVSAMDRSLAFDPAWRFSTLFIAIALSALFLGRTAARLRAYFAVARNAA